MKLMKLSAALVAAALILAGCSNPALSNTDLANKGAVQSGLVGGFGVTLTNLGLNAGSITGSLMATTAQTISIAAPAPIDLSGTTVPGLTVYPVTLTAGVYVRGTALIYTATQTTTTVGGASTVVLSLDLSALPNSFIEVVLDATSFSAASGQLKLDANGNKTVGEATDSVVKYLSVGSATVAGVAVPAAGTTEVPTATLSVGAPTNGLTTAGGTTLVYTVADSAGGTNVSSSTIFNPSNFKVQKFNYATRAWVDQSYTVTGTVPTITLTLATASAAGDSYRVYVADETAVSESAATKGFTHKWSYTAKAAVLSSFFTGAARAYTDAAGYVYQTFGGTATATFNGSQQGYVQIVFTGLGTAGLDPNSVTASTVQLFLNTPASATVPVAIQWTSSKVTSSATNSLNDTLWLYLPTNYTSTGTAASVKLFGLIDQGATTTGVGKAKAASLSNTTDLTQVISGFNL